MCDPRRWSQALLAGLLLWGGLLLAAPAWAAGGAAVPPDGAVRFVRGGFLLEAPGLAPGSLAVNGRAVGAAAIEGVPAGGWRVAAPWEPRGNVRISWRAASGAAALTLRAPLRPAPLPWLRIPWGDGGGGPGAGPITALAFSRDGALLAVGGQGGLAAVFRTRTGERVWRLRRPGRVIKHLAFGPAAQRLYVGEQGPEGRLAAYPLPGAGSGIGWVADTAAELGAATAEQARGAYGWVRQPGVYRILHAGDDVIAAFSRSWPESGGAAALGRVFRLEGATGRRQWAFPAGAPAPRVVTWLAGSAAGQVLALPLQLPGGAVPEAGAQDASRVVVLDGAAGRAVFQQSIPALPPRPVAEFWRGVAVHPDGGRVVAATQDGRAFWFVHRQGGWRVAQRRRLVAPVAIAGGLVGATNGSLGVSREVVLFVTGPSYAPLPRRNPAGTGGLAHPRANTVFAYDWEGRPLWIHRLENDLQGLAVAPGGTVAALAQGGEGPQAAGAFNGVTLLALDAGAGGRLRYRFPLAGSVPYGAVAVSPDGGWVALAEAPRVVLGDARRPGGHGVWLLR